MKLYEVPLTLAEYDSDIKIKACSQKSLSHCNQVLCLSLAQISGERLQDHWSAGFSSLATTNKFSVLTTFNSTSICQ